MLANDPNQVALTGSEKAAIVLLTLGPTVSAEILKRLPEDEVDLLSSAIARLDSVTPAQREAVMERFKVAVEGRGVHIKGGLEHARILLTEAFGREQASRLIDRVAKSLDQDAVDFSNLRRVDPQQLAKFIQDEHPQTIALVLSHLDSSQAAALISSLPSEIRSDVAVRMAGLEQISPESVRTIAAVIGQKLRNLGELSREACGGVRAVADMFNRMDQKNCNHLLDSLERDDLPLFESIRRFMFVFEDLQTLDRAGIKALMSRIDQKLLLVALKGTSEELQKLFTSAMSQRGADMLREDLAAMGPIKLKDVDAAQQTIIMQARELEKEGQLSLKNSPSEQYI